MGQKPQSGDTWLVPPLCGFILSKKGLDLPTYRRVAASLNLGK
jgi:hypothetical protein